MYSKTFSKEVFMSTKNKTSFSQKELKEKREAGKMTQQDIENSLTKFAWSNGLGCPCGTQFDQTEYPLQQWVRLAYDKYFGSFVAHFPIKRDGIQGGTKPSEPIQRSWCRTGTGNKFDLLLSLSSKGMTAEKHLLVDIKAKEPKGSFKCSLIGTPSECSKHSLEKMVRKKGYPIIFCWITDGTTYIRGFQPKAYVNNISKSLLFQKSGLVVWLDEENMTEQNGFTAVYTLTKGNLVKVTKKIYLMSK